MFAYLESLSGEFQSPDCGLFIIDRELFQSNDIEFVKVIDVAMLVVPSYLV